MRKLLKKYRGKRSQAEMAKMYNVKQQTWCSWENGQSVPRAKTLKRLSKDTGFSVNELFFL